MLSASCLRAAEAAARLPLLVACLLLFACRAMPAEDAVLAGRVTRVIDGDTLDVLLASGRIRVRLHGVDAPEHDQAGGERAKAWLRQRLQGRDVLLEPVSQDRYERLVAIVRLEGRSVNAELLRAGHAWAYRHYLRASDREFCELEFAARRQRAGLWGSAARAPWEFRATRGRGPFRDYSHQSAAECWAMRAKP